MVVAAGERTRYMEVVKSCAFPLKIITGKNIVVSREMQLSRPCAAAQNPNTTLPALCVHGGFMQLCGPATAGRLVARYDSGVYVRQLGRRHY